MGLGNLTVCWADATSQSCKEASPANHQQTLAAQICCKWTTRPRLRLQAYAANMSAAQGSSPAQRPLLCLQDLGPLHKLQALSLLSLEELSVSPAVVHVADWQHRCVDCGPADQARVDQGQHRCRHRGRPLQSLPWPVHMLEMSRCYQAQRSVLAVKPVRQQTQRACCMHCLGLTGACLTSPKPEAGRAELAAADPAVCERTLRLLYVTVCAAPNRLGLWTTAHLLLLWNCGNSSMLYEFSVRRHQPV